MCHHVAVARGSFGSLGRSTNGLSQMSDVLLDERLAHPESRNDALEELERVDGERAELDARVLAQVSARVTARLNTRFFGVESLLSTQK